MKMTEFCKMVENTVGKGEIACYKQLLFLSVFSKDLYSRHVKQRLVWERVNQIVPGFNNPGKEAF